MKPLVDRKIFGPWAIVTGSSSGIGAELARHLAASGVNPVLVARRLDTLHRLGKELLREFGVDYRAVEVDLSEPGAATKVARATDALDIGLVIGNAGFANPGELWTLDPKELFRAIHLKIHTNLELIHHFAPRLIARGRGGVLLTSSVGGLNGVPYVSNTAAIESYVLTLGEGLHVELKPYGVRVTVLMPGPTLTESMGKMGVSPSDMPMKPMSPVRVAAEGLRALQANHPKHVAGRVNRVMAKLMSRSLATKIMGAMIGKTFARPVLAAGAGSSQLRNEPTKAGSR
jgi:short-subunit dehydrogenase